MTTGNLIGTTTDLLNSESNFQRKTFYSNGRFWVFYTTTSTSIIYTSSTDGSTWETPVAVRAGSSVSFSIHFDGNFVHYAYGYETGLYYRRGLPNSDGTITWSAVEQTVTTEGNYVGFIAISTDSNGYVWIGYWDQVSGSKYPFVIKSGNNNGTWGTTPTGFPYQLSETASTTWKVNPIALTAGKMLVIYGKGATASPDILTGIRWTGTAWGTPVSTAVNAEHSYRHSAVAEDDDVHLVFLDSVDYNILYTKYTYTTNTFSAEATVQASTTSSTGPTLTIDSATGSLYCFWFGAPTAYHLYYKKCVETVWDTNPTDWIDESSDTLFYSDKQSCFTLNWGGYIGVVYMTKTSSPYNVKFAFLSVDALYANATMVSMTQITASAATLRGAMQQEGYLVTRRGFEWRVQGTSTWTEWYEEDLAGWSNGEYEERVTGLTSDSTYEVRAKIYAVYA